MSNKKLLSESEVRRFMTLANIPSLNEGMGVANQIPQDTRRPETGMQETAFPMGEEEELDLGDELDGDAGGEMDAGMGDEMGAGDEMGGDAAPAGDMQDAFRKAVEALAQAFGVKASVEDGGEHAEPDADNAGEEDGEDEEEGDEEESDEEEGDEELDESSELDESEETNEGEELDEAEDKKKKKGEEKEEEEEEVEESVSSTDELVETVLRRVTARLLAEKKDAEKKGAKKLSAKDKMAAMRAKKKGAKKPEDKKKKPVKEANASAPKAGQSNGAKNGLKAAGTANVDVWKGTKDHKWSDGVKKSGEKLKPVAANGNHTITHKKTNPLPSKGGNKKKV